MIIWRDRSPHGPIETAAEDLLGRGEFVRRLANALVTEDGQRARGRIIGLDGPWGSGKSSLLNLVEHELQRRCGDRLVLLRFNPWLVASGDDLLRAFFKEFSEKLPNDWRGICGYLADFGRPNARRAFIEAAGEIGVLAARVYGGDVSALAGIASASIRHLAETTPTLSETRTKLHLALSRLNRPIVVLIDEIDRAEPDEIRAMMLLIRAVVDAPSVTYLLAYDGQRLREVLGEGKIERGAKYLEKVVQVELPVPSPATGVLVRMLKAHVWAGSVPPESEKRWNQLCRVLFPHVIGSFRSLWRVQESFAILREMTLGEIDEVDLVGAAALKAMFPPLWEYLKRDWIMLTNTNLYDEIIDIEAMTTRALNRDPFTWNKWQIEEGTREARLLRLLFPDVPFSGEKTLKKEIDGSVIANVRRLSQGLPLQILMRLDRMEGVPTIAEAQIWLRQSRAEITARMLECHDYEAVYITEEAFRRAMAVEGHIHFPAFWCGLADALREEFDRYSLTEIFAQNTARQSRRSRWQSVWLKALNQAHESELTHTADILSLIIHEGGISAVEVVIEDLACAWDIPGFQHGSPSVRVAPYERVKGWAEQLVRHYEGLIERGEWLSKGDLGFGYRLLSSKFPNGLPAEYKVALNKSLQSDRNAVCAALLAGQGSHDFFIFNHNIVNFLFDSSLFISTMERICANERGLIADLLLVARGHGWLTRNNE